jgi:hypothetical protein
MSQDVAIAFINTLFDLLKAKTTRWQIFHGAIIEWCRATAIAVVPELLGKLKAKGVIQ